MIIEAHNIQFRGGLDFALFIYSSLNFYKILKKTFFNDVNGDVAQKLSKNLAFFKPLQVEINENDRNIAIFIQLISDTKIIRICLLALAC